MRFGTPGILHIFFRTPKGSPNGPTKPLPLSWPPMRGWGDGCRPRAASLTLLTGLPADLLPFGAGRTPGPLPQYHEVDVALADAFPADGPATEAAAPAPASPGAYVALRAALRSPALAARVADLVGTLAAEMAEVAAARDGWLRPRAGLRFGAPRQENCHRREIRSDLLRGSLVFGHVLKFVSKGVTVKLVLFLLTLPFC